MEDILRKVRGLLAKANSTTFEAERVTFLAKADEMMEKYAINQAMLQQLEHGGKARLVERRDMDISWWREIGSLHPNVKAGITSLWSACVNHCRCFSSFSVWDIRNNSAAVYGTRSDLSYLDMLFTDLLLQMLLRLKPKYDPNLSLGHNVARAKESGMKYTDVAHWIGRSDWVESYYTKRGLSYRTCDKGAMLRAYKKHLRENGGGQVISIHPDTYAMSFMHGFTAKVRERLVKMQEGRGSAQTGSTALVIRDIRDQAMEALYQDFPDLRPHPQGCECERCNPKPGKKMARVYRGGRRIDYAAMGKGVREGEKVRIVSNDPQVQQRKQIK